MRCSLGARVGIKADITISVIIANFNGAKTIRRCLRSVFASTITSYEVVVVDDASTDNSWALLKKMPHRMTLIHNKTNCGASISRNKGANRAHGKYLFFLDQDATTPPQTLASIAQYMEGHADVGAIQGCILRKDGKTIESVGHFISPFGYPYEISNTSDLIKGPMEILGGRTVGLAVRKDVFKEIGGFDETYLISGEDTDLCWRIWLAGKRVTYLPQAKIIHQQQSSLADNPKRRIYYEGTKNNLRNILKNLDTFHLGIVLPLYLMASLGLCLKGLVKNKFDFSQAVLAAIGWNIQNLSQSLQLRQNTVLPHQIIFGHLSIRDLTIKSMRWFASV